MSKEYDLNVITLLKQELETEKQSMAKFFAGLALGLLIAVVTLAFKYTGIQ
jgi:hypothetical protein